MTTPVSPNATKLTVANLSDDQRVAFEGIMSWLRTGTGARQTLTLGGYAGTGKSTVVSVVAHELMQHGALAFCAYTGKASSVLGRKLAESGIATINRIAPRGEGGVRSFEPRPYCGTIHGLVYRPCDVCMVEKVYAHLTDCPERDLSEPGGPAGAKGECLGCNPPPPPVKREGTCPRCQNGRYLRRDALDRNYKLIIVDEASMVDDDMLRVLTSYRIPILAVGDHGQLPPVKGQGSLMRSPALRLERIHRQAEGSPIIKLSQRIRETGDIDDALEDGDAFQIVPRRNLEKLIESRWGHGRLAQDVRSPEGAMGSVLVSWTNRLRVDLNHMVRMAAGPGEGAPKAGEVMICLKNAAPIYNGMRGVLVGDAERYGDVGAKNPRWRMTVDFVEDGQKEENLLASELQFFEEKTIDYEACQALGISLSQLGRQYDFGYAMTCHKMQGSQAPEVITVVEGGLVRMGREDRARWLYTAITRAAKKLVVVR